MLRVDEHQVFEGFLPEDFEAYEPTKWNSNMFTLSRLKVKDKLEVIGHELAQVLDDSNLSLVKHLSDEFPSLLNKKQVDTQWLFFSRDEAARSELTDLIDTERTLAHTLADPTPRYRQIFLGMAVNNDHLEIGLRMHFDAWVDRRNLLSLLDRDDGIAKIKETICALPEHYELTCGEELMSPANISLEDIRKLGAVFSEHQGMLFIGARMPADQVPVLGPDVTTTARETFELLIPVYRAIAWSPENDAISMDKLLEQRHEALKASHEEYDREREQRETQRKQEHEQGLKLRAEIEERIMNTQAWRQREISARRAAAAKEQQAKSNDARAKAEAMAAKLGLGGGKIEEKPEPVADKKPLFKSDEQPREQRREKRDHFQKRPDRKSFDKKPPQDSPLPRRSKVSSERAANIQVGDLIEVTKGFLRGRKGTVVAIEEKGDIRVNFGALASRLATEDVNGLGPAIFEPPKRPKDQGSHKHQNRAKLPNEKKGPSEQHSKKGS